MKTNKFFAAVLALAMAVACTPKNAGETAEGTPAESVDATEAAAVQVPQINPKNLLPSKSLKDSVSYLMGINFGSFLKGNRFGKDLNYSQIKKGMQDFLNAEGDMRDSNFVKQFRVNPEEMMEICNDYLSKLMEYTKVVNADKEVKFLSDNAKKEGVMTTPSGLQYIIEEAGADRKIGPQDTVFVRYKGTNLDGEVFDQTREDGEAVRMLMTRVIEGWKEGLQLIGEGGKLKLFVPASLAYGENGNQGIEPNSTLLFDVAVEKVNPFIEKVEE